VGVLEERHSKATATGYTTGYTTATNQ